MSLTDFVVDKNRLHLYLDKYFPFFLNNYRELDLKKGDTTIFYHFIFTDSFVGVKNPDSLRKILEDKLKALNLNEFSRIILPEERFDEFLFFLIYGLTSIKYINEVHERETSIKASISQWIEAKVALKDHKKIKLKLEIHGEQSLQSINPTVINHAIDTILKDQISRLPKYPTQFDYDFVLSDKTSASDLKEASKKQKERFVDAKDFIVHRLTELFCQYIEDNATLLRIPEGMKGKVNSHYLRFLLPLYEIVKLGNYTVKSDESDQNTIKAFREYLRAIGNLMDSTTKNDSK